MDKKRRYIAPDTDNAVEIDAIVAVLTMSLERPVVPGPDPDTEPEPDV